MRDIFIVGTGGLARETAQVIKLLQDNGEIGKFCGYICGSNEETGKDLVHGKVVCTDASILAVEEDIDIVIAITHPELKRRTASLYAPRRTMHFPNIIDPRSISDSYGSQLGYGNIIACGSHISCQISMGNFNLVNKNATIGHDVTIGSYCAINPAAHLAGFCTINDGVLIGAGAIVLERLRICAGATVGAGAVVTKDIDEAATYIGLPARKMPSRQ